MDVKKIEDKALGVITVVLSFLVLIGALTEGIKAAKIHIENNRIFKSESEKNV